MVMGGLLRSADRGLARGPWSASIARAREVEYAPGLRAGHGAVPTPPRDRRAMEAPREASIPTAKTAPARTPGTPRRFAALAAVLAWAVLQAPLSGCGSRPSGVGSLVPPRAAGGDALGPDVICDPEKHDVLLCWLAGDSSGWRVWFSRSADQGVTWSRPVAVSGAAELLRLEPESSPRIVCDEDGRIGIAWSAWAASAAGAPRASAPRLAPSLDGGRR